MTQPVLPPDIRRTIAAMQAEINALKRSAQSVASANAAIGAMEATRETFAGSWSDVSQLTAGHSGRGYLSHSHRHLTLVVAAGTAPTADLTVEVWRNGATKLGDVVIASGANGPSTETWDINVDGGDYLTYLGIGGTSAANITAKAVLR